MLKEKNPTPENRIVSIKLTTGEEIIATLLDFENGTLRIKKPLAMVMAENPENPTQTRVMFTPWMVSTDSDIYEIREMFVVSMSASRKDAADQYEQATQN